MSFGALCGAGLGVLRGFDRAVCRMMVGLFKLLVFIMEFHYGCIGSEELLYAIIPKGAFICLESLREASQKLLKYRHGRCGIL